MRNKRLNAWKPTLIEVVQKIKPEMTALAESVGETPLTRKQRDQLRSILVTEMCSTGLLPNSEPNARGLMLDDIISKLGAY